MLIYSQIYSGFFTPAREVVARTGILSGGHARRVSRPESRLGRFFDAKNIALRFDSQAEATQVAFSLSNFLGKIGQDWNRTSDTRIFSPLLYHLSYLAIGKMSQDSWLLAILAMKRNF